MPKGIVWIGGAALVLGLMVGCGGGALAVQDPDSQSVAPIDPATAGTLTVKLVPDGPAGALSSLSLVFTALELRQAGQWRAVPLSAPGTAVDLLAASSAAPRVLASAVPWPVGSNDALRFTLGQGNGIQLAAEDTGFHTLTVPAQVVSTLGPPGSFSVATGAETELWITFSVADVALPDPEDSEVYHFFPGPVRGYDRAATGSLSGGLATLAAAPLAGATVSAQRMLDTGEEGAALAFRTVTSDAEGHYQLDLLPLGYTWCVVSQPSVADVVYLPAASPGFALGRAPFDAYETSLAFRAGGAGTVSGTLATPPGADSRVTVDLVQEMLAGGVACSFVLQSAPLLADGQGGYGFRFAAVPPGIYAARLNRYSLSGSLGLLDQTASTARFVVSAGQNVALTF